MSGVDICTSSRQQIADYVSHAVRLDSTDEEALKVQSTDKVDVAIMGIGQGTEGGKIF